MRQPLYRHSGLVFEEDKAAPNRLLRTPTHGEPANTRARHALPLQKTKARCLAPGALGPTCCAASGVGAFVVAVWASVGGAGRYNPVCR